MTVRTSFGSRIGLNCAPDLILERPDERLLARDPVEVGVGVPEADVVERLIAAEPLIPGKRLIVAKPVGPLRSLK